MKKALFLSVCILWALCGCSGSDDSDSGMPDPPGPEPEENTVKLSNDDTYGQILTDADGMTLYFFSNDSRTASTCSDGCINSWPVFYADDLRLDEGLESGDFGTITRDDGDTQTTYKGWPLYYFAGDNAAGEVNGDGVNEIWYVAKPDYSLMYVNAQLVGDDEKNYIVNENGEYVEGDGKTKYVTDATGNTLYAFAPDKKDTNTYTDEDFSNDAIWPIFHVALENIPSILNMADFNTISVHGERDQLTYKGWPMYYFGADGAKGDNKGISFPSPGVWPIFNTDTQPAPEP